MSGNRLSGRLSRLRGRLGEAAMRFTYRCFTGLDGSWGPWWIPGRGEVQEPGSSYPRVEFSDVEGLGSAGGPPRWAFKGEDDTAPLQVRVTLPDGTSCPDDYPREVERPSSPLVPIVAPAEEAAQDAPGKPEAPSEVKEPSKAVQEGLQGPPEDEGHEECPDGPGGIVPPDYSIEIELGDEGSG